MARKPRLHLPGGLYHVMLRGNDGQPIFFAEGDYEHFSDLVAEGVDRFGHRIHAYCWMPNHVHLAVQVAETPLGKIVQNVAFRYARWINRREGRTGHLFQGRYRAILVDSESYLLALVRYIHLNPVRAGLVADPARYAWSGHRAYLRQAEVPWLTTDWVLSQFAAGRERAQAAYGRFVMAGIGEPRREEFHVGSREGPVLGNDDFVRRVLSRCEEAAGTSVDLESIVGQVCRILGVEATDLGRRTRRAAEARAWIALLAVETKAASLTEVSRRFGRDVATLSNAVRRLRARIREGGRQGDRWRALREALEKEKRKA